MVVIVAAAFVVCSLDDFRIDLPKRLIDKVPSLAGCVPSLVSTEQMGCVGKIKERVPKMTAGSEECNVHAADTEEEIRKICFEP